MSSSTGFLTDGSLFSSLPFLLAQYSSSSSEPLSPVASVIITILQIAIYAVIAYCTQVFLKKLNYEKAWFAWIPLLNLYAILEAGEDENPLLWTVLALIPCISLVSLVKWVMAYIRICNRLGKSPAILWTFLLCGLGGLIVPLTLAFT